MAQSPRLFTPRLRFGLGQLIDLMRLDRAAVPSAKGHRDDFRGVCLSLDANGNVGLRAKTPFKGLGQFGTADRLSQITMHSNQRHSPARFLAWSSRPKMRSVCGDVLIGDGSVSLRNSSRPSRLSEMPCCVPAHTLFPMSHPLLGAEARTNEIRCLATSVLDGVEVYGVGHAIRVVHVVRQALA